ncbi:MAG: DUF177 domain-containing protein [Alphaproteobacteria bacterium]|nr:DUF177 domain-containing protein [Alphaproteobacteria bacterium]MBO6629013.1 DUF177 domain-containing protein [Alphaproteobacteria bacterium]MDF1624844.1 DUF177 domain-containing protein [Parvibaculaceae bacterium]
MSGDKTELHRVAIEKIPGFYRLVSRLDVPDTGVDVHLVANEQARAQLASRFGLLSLDAFRADLVVTVWRRRGIRAEGRIQANVVQPCVVTLDPVPEVVDEKITLLFYPEDLSGRQQLEVTVDPLDEEPPDGLPAEGVDLGEAVAEQLALALNPYPRVPGAKLAPVATSDDVVEKKPNPFEALKNLKTKE